MKNEVMEMRRLFCLGLCSAVALGAKAAKLEVETGTCYHAAVRPATNLTARIDLDAGAVTDWTGAIEFRDYFGKTFSVPVAGRGAKGAPLRVKLPEPPGMGIWRGTAKLVSATGGKIEATCTFAVLDPHPVTPLAPRESFRIGINYHVTRYHPALRHQMMAALVGVGAKMMRGDLGAMCLNQPKEGEYHWEMMDTIVGELQANGIAIDAIIPTVPAWARHPDYVNVTNGPSWVVPTKPGVDAAYGRALAARYGMKIEYYEIGNELDLVPATHLTVEQAMARQRDYYKAIKSVCPAAQVIPCGWAFADSSSWMVRQKGFQERFMREAQAACDFHPVHIHATYANFRREMLKFFAWRKRDGVTIPWYANETAASSCAGQEDSAAMWVWQKALWAWAHGSKDYIWYNLRSVGPDPENGEHAYGIFTMDLQPRSTAAAFSALTAVFNGQTFDAALCDAETCQLYRFRTADARTLVGWDSVAMTPRKVKVLTNASSCESVDLMGNRRSLNLIVDPSMGTNRSADLEVRAPKGASHSVTSKVSVVEITLGLRPMAYVLKGATFADVDSSTLTAASRRTLEAVVVEPSEKRPDTPALVLDSMKRYHGFCDGNANTEHRLWKGPKDLSAKVFVWQPKGQTVHARIEVTDDKPVAYKAGTPRTGDHLRIVFNGQETIYSPIRMENVPNMGDDTSGVVRGTRAIYEFDLPWHAVPGPLAIEIYDDDGEGLDGFLGGDDFLLCYK